MKLEFKHLVPYLLYELKGIETKKGTIKELLSIDLVSGCRVGDMDEDYNVGISQFKPILHPLSDLTKEITHNGETFIPVVELAKIADCHYVFIPELGQIKTFIDTGCNVIQVHWKDEKENYFEMSTGIDESRFENDNDGITFTLGSSYAIHNLFTLYQKMFEWKIDVLGLIDKDLAVDINTIKK